MQEQWEWSQRGWQISLQSPTECGDWQDIGNIENQKHKLKPMSWSN